MTEKIKLELKEKQLIIYAEMLKQGYNQGKITVDEIKQVINSYSAHLSHGSCNSLMQKRLSDFLI